MKGLSEEDLVKVLKRAFAVDKFIQCSEVGFDFLFMLD